MTLPGIRDGWFVDSEGRRLLLRGVNLGGSSKLPMVPDGATHRAVEFYEHRAVSFVGRPFPLDEAGDHFDRLRRWGFTLLRLVVPWEAIEHGGPGLFDEDYLGYIVALVEKAAAFDFMVIIDPHQDAWSRHCGGSGAPGWTLESVGLNVRSLGTSGAALLHHEQRGAYPRMIWATNIGKFAAATMFTLFFGGNYFAPRLRIDGEPVQEFLQRRFLSAFSRLAASLDHLPNVLGFDTFNEPSPGYIGCDDLERRRIEPKIGAMPTPLQSFALADGIPQHVARYRMTSVGSVRSGTSVVNPGGVRAWNDDRECIFRSHGVWEPRPGGRPRILSPRYFADVAGKPVDFACDCLAPFIRRFADAVRIRSRSRILFVEPPPRMPLPTLESFAGRGAEAGGGAETGIGASAQASTIGDRSEPELRIASAPHWYDGVVLVLGRYFPWLGGDYRVLRPIVGRRRIRRSYAAQLCELSNECRSRLPGAPVLVGEIGVPHGMEGAMNRSLTALDDAMLSYVIWNYTADNSVDHGDGWNAEDFSIYARWSDDDSREAGGRALRAVIRPGVRAAAGIPLHQSFDPSSGRYELELIPCSEPDAATAPTVIFVPRYQYPGGYCVSCSGGRWQRDDAQEILYCWDGKRAHTSPETARFRVIITRA